MCNQKLLFLFLNQNICCGYSKELSQWDGSFEHPKQMLELMEKKIFTILCWKYLPIWTKGDSHEENYIKCAMNRNFVLATSYSIEINKSNCRYKQKYLTRVTQNEPSWSGSTLFSKGAFFYLFDLILYVPSTIFQLNGDGSSWVELILS